MLLQAAIISLSPSRVRSDPATSSSCLRMTVFGIQRFNAALHSLISVKKSVAAVPAVGDQVEHLRSVMLRPTNASTRQLREGLRHA